MENNYIFELGLDHDLETYFNLLEREAEIKARKEELKREICSYLEEIGENSYLSHNGKFKGSKSVKTSVKYDDEMAIIAYLKQNDMNQYLKTTIDTTNFNKALKSNQSLQESLGGKFSTVESPMLVVKKVID